MSRRRRTKVQIAQLENRIVEILRADNPQSVRHVFYRLVDDKSLDVPYPKRRRATTRWATGTASCAGATA